MCTKADSSTVGGASADHAPVRREQIVFRAGLSRVVLGLLAFFILPALYPQSGHRLLLSVYVGLAMIEQLLIRRDIGGPLRAFLFGLVDLALITFLVQRLGSCGTSLVSLYFFSGMMTAIVVDLRVGVALAAIGSAAYAAIVLAECARWLPYAPDVPSLSARAPSLGEAMTAIVLVTSILVSSAALVAYLVRALRVREAELTDANRRLEELSRRDPLTHLFNRRHLLERIEDGLAFVRRGRPLALVMIDLDGFKSVNDRDGHARGDSLLQRIGAALADSTRTTDVASRYGGDEFAILLPDTDRARAQIVAERIVEAVREIGASHTPSRPVTASVGLALALPEDSPATLLRRADEHAYRAKRSGGDRAILAA
jgi:diguanylate cyclase